MEERNGSGETKTKNETLGKPKTIRSESEQIAHRDTYTNTYA